MALSKSGSEAEILARLLQSQQEMALNIKHLTECIYKMSEKVSCGEMRQCMTSGEGTDAARMLGLYLRGHSAQWTKHTKEVILESVYENGNFDAVEYTGIFHKKDVRRGELAVACFYLTAIEKVKMVFNPFLDRGRPNGTAQMAPIRGGLRTFSIKTSENRYKRKYMETYENK